LVAVTYAAIGDKDNAFAELEKAYKSHDWFLQRMKVDPFLDPLRDDPRFEDLLKRSICLNRRTPPRWNQHSL
jgi:hypothetical protein